jgi:hypothetical protein
VIVDPKTPSPDVESHNASWVLRLLVGAVAVGGVGAALDSPPLAPPAGLDWDALLDLVRANGVLVRTADRLEALAIAVPDRFAQAVADERRRIRSTLELMLHVGTTCEARGIPYSFPKAFQDYPDFGDDVDLLVLPRSTRVDTAIVAGLPTVRVSRDLGERFAGTATYRIHGCSSPLDVQHGRFGIVGEHDEFPRVLIQHARPIIVDGMAFAEPPPEDQLVLQGLQRVPGRLRIALCDVVFTVSTVRRAALDWEYVIGTARRHGALPGLGCYLGYVDQIHRDVFARPLLPDAVARALTLEGWGRIAFREGGYRFPIVRANGRLYWGQLRHRIASGDWGGAGRLFLIPLVAGARAGRRLARGGGGGPGLVPTRPEGAWNAPFVASSARE